MVRHPGLLPLLAAAALAGCGGVGTPHPPPPRPAGSPAPRAAPLSAPRSTAADYGRRIGALASKFAARSAAFSRRIRRAHTPGLLVAAFRFERNAANHLADDLSALRPPPAVARPHRQLAHGLHALAADIGGAIRAAHRGDRVRLRALARRFAGGRLRSLREIRHAAVAIDARLGR